MARNKATSKGKTARAPRGQKEPQGSTIISGRSRSLEIAKKGIKTGRDFRGMMSALMTDVIAGTVSPGVCNAACNAGGKLIKIVELEIKYGTRKSDDTKELLLTTG